MRSLLTVNKLDKSELCTVPVMTMKLGSCQGHPSGTVPRKQVARLSFSGLDCLRKLQKLTLTKM